MNKFAKAFLEQVEEQERKDREAKTFETDNTSEIIMVKRII